MNGWQVIIETVVPRIGWTLVHSLWQGLGVAAGLWISLQLLRNAAATKRYAACCIAMALTVGAAGATFALTGEHEGLGAAPSRKLVPTARAGEVSISQMPVAAAVKMFTGDARRRNVLQCIVLIWAAGVIVMTIRHVGGWAWLVSIRRGKPLSEYREALARLMKRLHVTRIVALIETSRLDVPAVIGVLRPVILIPVGVLNDLTPQQVEAILAHELAHIRRNDYLVNLLQAAVETLMFYHPAIWWMSSRMRAERENCCDDIAAGACGNEKVYASALAALEHRRAAAPRLATAANSGGELLTRVRRVLKLPPRQGRAPMRSLAAAALALTCAVLPLAVLAQQKSQQSTTTPAAAAIAPDENAKQPSDFDHPSPITPDDLVVGKMYRANVNDLVTITITGLNGAAAETVKTLRISEKGTVSLPQLPFKLAGLTGPDAAKAIAQAYRDNKMLPANGTVLVDFVEKRGLTFSILGQVPRPGQYQITQLDFRILDALVSCGAKPADIEKLFLIRADKRVLAIPIRQLAAGHLAGNVVIRDGDMLMVPSPATTQTVIEFDYLPIVIGKAELTKDGKPITIAQLDSLLKAMPESQRQKTALAVAAGSKDITVERFFTASAALNTLVTKYGLAYLSQTGISEIPLTSGTVQLKLQPATGPVSSELREAGAVASARPPSPDAKSAANSGPVAPLPPATQSGEYFIEGNVSGTGVYALTRQKVSLKQAIIAAGGVKGDVKEAYVSVIRPSGETEDRHFARNISVDDLMNSRVQDFFLKAGDIVRVSAGKLPLPPTSKASTREGLLTPQPSTSATQPGSDARPAGPASDTTLVAGDGLDLLLLAQRRNAVYAEILSLSQTVGDQHPKLLAAKRQFAELTEQIGRTATPEQIATIDDTMREYIKQRDQRAFRLAQLRRNLGDASSTVRDAKSNLDLQQQRIDAYATAYRNAFKP